MERSPPDSSDTRRTLRPMGRTSISTPVLSGSSGSVKMRATLTPGEQHRDQRREVLVHVGDRRREGGHDLVIERPQHLLEFAPGVAHVAHLRVELLVAIFERRQLLEREGIDGSE